ncbi:MAG TPA: hypothetical protein DEB06_01940 [Phycisphaerales bacterium]|nr:hypothetical protein [Phycisphaerales bacterium]
MRSGLRTLLLALACALAGVGVSVARAQLGWYGGDETRVIHEDDLRSLIAKAGLTPDQSDAAMDLFRGYDAQRREGEERIERFQNDFFRVHGRLTGADSPEWTRALAVYESYARFQKRQRERLLEDLHAVLTPEQGAGWEAFERSLRRRSALGRSLSSLGSLDLGSLATASLGGVAPPPELLQTIERYEVELDRAVRALETAADNAERAVMEQAGEIARLSDEEQEERWKEQSQPLLAASRAVRDINLRFREPIGALLPGPARAAFDRFCTRGLAYIHGHDDRSGGGELIEAALKTPGLTEEQRLAIAGVAEGVSQEERERIEEAIRRICALEDSGRMAWEIHQDPDELRAFDTMRERREASLRAAIARLRAILTPEQLAAAPEPLRPIELEYPTFDD